MAYSTSEEDSDSNSDDVSDPEIQTIYTFQPVIAFLPSPTPMAQVHRSEERRVGKECVP